MARQNLVAQNSTIEIDLSAAEIHALALAVASGAHADAAIAVQVKAGASGDWMTIGVRAIADETVVTEIGTGEGAWQWLTAWHSVRAIRTDANAGDCYVTLETR